MNSTMKTTARLVFLCGALVLCAGPNVWAAEKWADPKLPVTEGLELWLDAARLPAANEANGVSPPRAGGGVSVWYDASGRKRDARQDGPGRRPQFRTDLATVSAAPAIVFDGRDDVLVSDITGVDLRDFTVFVVASPYAGGVFRAILAANE